ncbi:MAG: sugar transferase [Acidimicrobiales bacterium]
MIKRGSDIAVAACLLVVTLPVMVVATVAAAISLRAWPFFAQTRIGRDGTPFYFFKLRTLPKETPRYATKYDVAGLAQPRLGRWLRMLHLDEFPQLLLVLTGKMSIVGPRPEMPHLCEQFDPAFARRRATVRPGCTGLWQISDRCDRMIHEAPEFDEFYVRHRSLRLDLWVMLRTLSLVLPVSRARLTSYDELPAWAGETAAPVAASVLQGADL